MMARGVVVDVNLRLVFQQWIAITRPTGAAECMQPDEASHGVADREAGPCVLTIFPKEEGGSGEKARAVLDPTTDREDASPPCT